MSTWNWKNIFPSPKGYASICFNIFEIFLQHVFFQIILIFMIRDYIPYMSSVASGKSTFSILLRSAENDQIFALLNAALVRNADSTLEKGFAKKRLAKCEKQSITLKLNYVIFKHDGTMRKLRTLRFMQSKEFRSTILMIVIQSDHVQV